MARDATGILASSDGKSEYVQDMRFGVLGPIEVSEKRRRLSVGGPKQRTVLALLISRAGSAVSTDLLVDGVYGDGPPQGARRSVQTYVSNLRGELGEVIEASGSGYVLSADRSDVDALRFEDAVSEAVEIDDPEHASQILRDALALWRGHPYADVDGFVQLSAERTRLNELRLSTIELRIDSDLERGQHRQLIAELESLTEEHPLRERLRAQQMLALYRCGRQAEALRAYEKTRNYLVDEMGLDPSPDLRDLEHRILAQDPGLAFETGPTVKQASILVADVSDPGDLSRLDPVVRDDVITQQTNAIRGAVADNEGEVFAHRGTVVYTSFGHVELAVNAAAAIQQALADVGQTMRMAVSVGEVQIAKDETVQGPPVTRAAQLVAAAHGGQVLLSTEANQSLSESGGAGWVVRSLGQHDVAGSGEARPVYQLMVDGLESDFPPLRSDLLPLPLPIATRGLPGYELRERVGSGAFGAVHLAYQPSVGREVAIKIVRPEYANDPEFIRRFEVEAQLVARLEHPHIVPLHDYWRNPDGAFLVMRWLSGGTLKDKIAGGHLTLDETQTLLADIGPALAFAHRRGVVHRDIKLSNVLLDDEGGAYLSDFGIASDIALKGAGSVSRDVQALAALLRRCLGDSSDPSVADVLTTATATESFADVDSFISAWDRALGAGEPVPRVIGFTPTRNPYKGLSAFGELDAADFHGRSAETEKIIDTLSNSPLVAVVGPSGIGKSSVVRAGMIPALRSNAISGSDRWLITGMLPGAYPYEELALALIRVAAEMPIDLEEDLRRDTRGLARAVKRYMAEDSPVLLVIDQFEELFTLAPDDEREAFLAMLAATIDDERSNIRIVITMRADYFDRPLRFADLGDALRTGTIPISAPSDAGLRAIVARPAEGVGIAFEPGLVDRIIGDVRHQPGALPLLEFSLTELFERRDSDLVTSDAYEASGGVLGALGRRGERTYAELDSKGQDAAREVFLRLVNVAEAGRDTRRRVRLTELERLGFSDLVLRSVLDAFGGHRLLTFDRDPVTHGPTVEVAHEAILSEWPRLVGWIEDHREDLLLRSRLAVSVADWEAWERSDAYLLAGGRLIQHESWTAETELTLTSVEHEFLAASRAAEDERRARRRRTRRLVLSGFGIAALIGFVLAAAALAQRNTALDQTALAEENAAEAAAERESAVQSGTLARSRELAAAAVTELDRDPELSLLLAIQAADLAEPTLESTSALREALGRHRAILTYALPPDRATGIPFGDISPDGRSLAVADNSGLMQVVDIDSGEIRWGFDLGEGVVFLHPIFMSDGRTIVAGAYHESDDPPMNGIGGLHFLDTSTGDVVRYLEVGDCGVTHAGFRDISDDFVYALIPPCGGFGPHFRDLPVQRIDLVTGAAIPMTEKQEFRVNASDDESRVIISTYAGEEILVVDGATGDTIFTGPENVGGQVAAISPDGTQIVYDSGDSLEVMSIVDGTVISRNFGHSTVWNAWYSDDGQTMYSSGPDGVFQLWDSATGETILTIPYGDAVFWSATSSDLSRAAVFSGSNTVKVFDLTDTFDTSITAYPVAQGCENPLYMQASLHVVGDRATVQVECENDVDRLRTLVFDIENGRQIGTVHFSDGNSGRLSPDGLLLASMRNRDGVSDAVVIYDAESGDEVRELVGLCPVTWDGVPITVCEDYPATPFADFPQMFDFSPDGTKLAMAGALSNAVIVWDVESGEMVATWELGQELQGIDFSDDGTRLAVGTTVDIALYSTEDWSMLVTQEFRGSGRAPGFSLQFAESDTRLVAAAAAFQGGSDVLVLDTETLAVVTTIEQSHDGGVRTLDVSSDDSLIATVGVDGFARLWDLSSGDLVSEIVVVESDQAKNVQFVSEDRELMVTGSQGLVTILTIDNDEQLRLARARLTRTLTERECSTYHIDPCPTLEEIKGG